METKTNDGGTAFPHMEVTERNICIPVGGMSLRDYFAAKALQAIMGHLDLEKMKLKSNDGIAHEMLSIARASYLFSDQMIKAKQGK